MEFEFDTFMPKRFGSCDRAQKKQDPNIPGTRILSFRTYLQVVTEMDPFY